MSSESLKTFSLPSFFDEAKVVAGAASFVIQFVVLFTEFIVFLSQKFNRLTTKNSLLECLADEGSI